MKKKDIEIPETTDFSPKAFKGKEYPLIAGYQKKNYQDIQTQNKDGKILFLVEESMVI